jgi:hypothetical protein
MAHRVLSRLSMKRSMPPRPRLRLRLLDARALAAVTGGSRTKDLESDDKLVNFEIQELSR